MEINKSTSKRAIAVAVLCLSWFAAAHASTPVKFVSHPTYCKLFLGLDGHGTDGLAADYSVALNDALGSAEAGGVTVSKAMDEIKAHCSSRVAPAAISASAQVKNGP
jgi:hypothetical protein